MATPPRLARRLIAAVCILTSGTGCLTQKMWEQANETSVTFSQIIGVGESQPNHQRQLIVRYGSDADAPVLRIPLDADGRPMPPFAWTGGTLPPGRGYFDQVPEPQRRQIADAAVLEPAGKSPAVPPPVFPFIDFATDSTLALAAYRVTPDGRLEPAKLPAAAADSAQPWTPFPPDVRVVLLPMLRPDTVRMRDKRLRAIALTPVTLAADATIGGVVVAVIAGVLYVAGLGHMPLNGSWFNH